MEWLNYHHLYYFWAVARHGSIARACGELHLTQPTISTQLADLEKALGEKLFHRDGRRLALTETGQVVFSYADEIFSLGRELLHTIRGKPRDRPQPVLVGIVDALPKLIVYNLLEVVTRLQPAVRLVCLEDKPDRLLAELAVHRLDVVLSDAPVTPLLKVKAFNHLLGECGTTWFGVPMLAAEWGKDFPASLEGAPVLLPTSTGSLRRELDQWFTSQGVSPTVRAEFQDMALLKVFGERGAGLFPAPSILEAQIERQYRVKVVGRAPGVRQRYYAISVERRLKHPAVIAICEAARQELFA